MIICPQCNHQNSDDSTQCEACLSVLPLESSCPNCGCNNLDSARFCGLCGYALITENPFQSTPKDHQILGIPEPEPPEPVLNIRSSSTHRAQSGMAAVATPPQRTRTMQPPSKDPETKDLGEEPIAKKARVSHSSAQMQGILIHQATQFQFSLTREKAPIYIGKPNRKITPDINLATFKNSEVVSRIHAKILINENVFHIQDEGSANGTFINHQRIPSGEKRILNSGDEISLGKGNLVAFTFELS